MLTYRIPNPIQLVLKLLGGGAGDRGIVTGIGHSHQMLFAGVCVDDHLRKLRRDGLVLTVQDKDRRRP